MEGFTVFYLHHTDSLPVMKRSFQLTADIMVTIYLKKFKKVRNPLFSRQFKSEAQKESMQENHITNASQKVAQNGILEHLLGTFLKEVLWNKSRDVRTAGLYQSVPSGTRTEFQSGPDIPE